MTFFLIYFSFPTEKIQAAGAQAKTLETEKKQREEKSAHRLENYYNVPAIYLGIWILPLHAQNEKKKTVIQFNVNGIQQQSTTP